MLLTDWHHNSDPVDVSSVSSTLTPLKSPFSVKRLMEMMDLKRVPGKWCILWVWKEIGSSFHSLYHA